MNYINVDLLKQKMYQESFEKDSDLQKWEGGCWIRYKLFENVLDQIPIENVKPIIQGEWINIDLNHGKQCWCNCSVCGIQEEELTNYCPRCGAKMEKGESVYGS